MRLRSRFATLVAVGWLTLVGLLTFGLPASNRYTGRVVSISDTAQFFVLKNGRPESLRLAAVEFPEKGQSHARAARALASRLAVGMDVRVEESGTKDGARTGSVTLPGGKNLSAELVKAGLAWPSARDAGPFATSLAALQMRAMSDRRGVWAIASPRNSSPAVRIARFGRAPRPLAVLGSEDPDDDDSMAASQDGAITAEAGTSTLADN